MQYKNLFKSDFVNYRSVEEVVSLMEAALNSFNTIVDYYSYDKNTQEYDDPIKIKIIFDIETDVNSNSGFKFDNVLNFVTLSKYFTEKDINPKYHDKIIYSGATYYVNDVVYLNKIPNLDIDISIFESIIVSIRAIKQGNFSLTEL